MDGSAARRGIYAYGPDERKSRSLLNYATSDGRRLDGGAGRLSSTLQQQRDSDLNKHFTPSSPLYNTPAEYNCFHAPCIAVVFECPPIENVVFLYFLHGRHVQRYTPNTVPVTTVIDVESVQNPLPRFRRPLSRAKIGAIPPPPDVKTSCLNDYLTGVEYRFSFFYYLRVRPAVSYVNLLPGARVPPWLCTTSEIEITFNRTGESTK